MSASRRGSPQAVNPGVEAPRPQNSNFLLSPLKMSWDTGIAVRVSLHALTARGTASPPSLVPADQLSSAPPRDPDAPPPKLLPPGSRRTTHARDADHAHGHSPRSLNPAHSKFPSESAVRDKWDVCGSCTIARRMRSALSAELGRGGKAPVLRCADTLENDRGRCKLAVTAHHCVIYAPSVSGRFSGWVREGRASDCGGSHRRVSPSLFSSPCLKLDAQY